MRLRRCRAAFRNFPWLEKGVGWTHLCRIEVAFWYSAQLPPIGNGWIWNNRRLESKGSPRLRWRELMLDWNGQGWEAHPAESTELLSTLRVPNE